LNRYYIHHHTINHRIVEGVKSKTPNSTRTMTINKPSSLWNFLFAVMILMARGLMCSAEGVTCHSESNTRRLLPFSVGIAEKRLTFQQALAVRGGDAGEENETSIIHVRPHCCRRSHSRECIDPETTQNS
jgi:hypothetical protein